MTKIETRGITRQRAPTTPLNPFGSEPENLNFCRRRHYEPDHSY